jgi:tetratricopeptide (TPR) repeat protein
MTRDLNWLEESEEYRALVRALRRKRGFGLFFIATASLPTETDILAGLKEELPGKTIVTVDLDRSSQDLFSLIKKAWPKNRDMDKKMIPKEPNKVVVWVKGLGQTLLDYEDLKRLAGQDRDLSYSSKLDVPPLLGQLNLGRDRFSREFPCSIVMVVPPYTVRYLVRRAGDFFDWKSGFFEFSDDNSHKEIRLFLANGEAEIYTALEPSERMKCILEADTCLASGTLITNKEKASVYREIGRLYFSGKQYKSALFNFDKAIEFIPDSHEILNNRGLSLCNLDRHEDAIRSYDKALRIKSDYQEAWNNRGVSLGKLGRYEEAIVSFDKAIESNSNKHDAYYARGICLSSIDWDEEAIQSFNQALVTSPNSYGAWYAKGISLSRLGWHEEAIESFNKAIDIKVDFHEAWIGKGDNLSHLRHRKEAVKSYEEALKIQPKNYLTWHKRGLNLSRIGQHKKSIKSYRKSLKINPDFQESKIKFVSSLRNKNHLDKMRRDHKFWHEKGVRAGIRGMNLKAIKNYSQAIAIEPNKSIYYYGLGLNLGALGRWEEAIENYDKALKIQPGLHIISCIRGEALFAIEKYIESILSYDKALEFNPNLYIAWHDRGKVLLNIEQYEESIRSFDKAIEVNPDLHEAWNNRGISLSNLGRYEEAIASYDKAIEFKPDKHEAIYNKACAYALQNQLTPALEHLKQAIELNPEHNRTLAQTDSDFDSIRDNEQFQALLSDP